jgi:hypothetical protein
MIQYVMRARAEVSCYQNRWRTGGFWDSDGRRTSRRKISHEQILQ